MPSVNSRNSARTFPSSAGVISAQRRSSSQMSSMYCMARLLSSPRRTGPASIDNSSGPRVGRAPRARAGPRGRRAGASRLWLVGARKSICSGRTAHAGGDPMPATRNLHDLGQSLWLDNITRELLDGGALARYIDEFSVTGLTSNPTIFDHALKHGDAYQGAIREQ